MKYTNEIKLSFPSKSSNEAFARSSVAAFAAQLDPTLEELNDIKTAVSEAVTNSIVHAYPNSVETIHIRVRLFEDNVIEISVKDKGLGIPDVEKARTPLFTTGDQERSGMGFTIMESFMDSIKVSSKEGRGTTVTMKKRISMRISGRSSIE